MTSQTKTQRITVKLKTPNPLFEKWITEWRDQAKENNSKMQYTFSNALKTLKKYPLPLDSGKDCLILKGFGKTLCDMLDKKLFEYKKNGNENIITYSTPNKAKSRKEDNKQQKHNNSSNSARKYKPAYRSGPYAILLTLLKESQKNNANCSLSKSDIIKYGRDLCDKSFIKPDPGSFYTAWSSMSTLVSKELVLRKGSPPKFSLTEKGELLAITLLSDENISLENDIDSYVSHLDHSEMSKDIEKENIETKVNELSSQNTVTSSEISSESETIIFAPYCFDVILLVDTQETVGGTRNPADDEAIAELRRLNVNFEVRHLKVGDFTWISREKNSKQELVLPYIVERKRMDDLGHSIKDGRFHEQKFRLKQCGIQNLLYIVESYGNNTRTALPLSSLMQGATNTLIQDNFQVKFTENLRHSMQYLSGFTYMLKHIFEKKTLMGCTRENLPPVFVLDDLIPVLKFEEFNKVASKLKKFKVKDIFVRQLLQLNGVSVEKALAIVEKYPTPKLLKQEYDRLGSNGKTLLSSIEYGPLKKAIGPAISHSIFQLYNTDILM